MNDQRLTDIEIKISHQELQIEKLEKVLYEQQLIIDRLDTAVNDLVKIIKQGQIGPANEKPPHY
jgi:SlyX protein